MEITEKIKQLILDYLQGNVQKKEADCLKSWLDVDNGNKEYFERIKLSWILAGKLSKKKRFDENQLWNKLHSKLKQAEGTSHYKYSRKTKFNHILKIACSWIIFFLLGSSITYWYTCHNLTKQHKKTIVYSPFGAKNHIVLPDGTSVWLNSGSSLEYDDDYNFTRREVTLSGEGYFKVTPSKKNPFIVRTHDISITALGTKFNVKAYPEENMITTTLVDGQAIIERTDDKNIVFKLSMEPQQKVTYYYRERTSDATPDIEMHNATREMDQNKSSVPHLFSTLKVLDVNTDIYTSWKDSSWHVESERFDNLIRMLERRYKISVTLCSEELKNYSFSGTIENETPEQLFEMLRLTLPIDYTFQTNRVFIHLDEDLKKEYERFI